MSQQPRRRQSLAPSSNAGKSRQGLGRKRAQSLIPSDARHVAPRKSILKSTPFTFSVPAQEQQQEQLQQDLPQQEQLFHNIGPAQTVDDDIESMETDAGTDYRAEVSDNTSRKSLGRRVSFAPFAQYRVFETNDQNTNSSGGPSSSPAPASPSEPEQSPPSNPIPAPRLSNENDYPGRRTSLPSARRVSTASGYGETSMSLDMDDDDDDEENSEPPTDPVFFDSANRVGEDADAPDDDDFEDMDEDEDDMEITEAIALNINRKRSLSIAQQHAMARRSSLAPRRSSVKFSQPPSGQSDDEQGENERSEEEGSEDVTTASQMTQESEAPMEFTIPLEKSLKEPKPPSEAWLALQAVTHSQGDSNDDDDGEEMELTNALSRLRKARASFDFGGQNEAEDDHDAMHEEASFTSTDDSMNSSMDMGDRTLNVTNLMGSVRNLEISGDDSERDTGAAEDEDFARPLLPSVATMPLNIQRKEAPTPVAPVKGFSSVFTAPTPVTNPAIAMLNPPLSQIDDEPDSRKLPSSIAAKVPEESNSSRLKPPGSSVFTAPPSPSRIPVPSSPSKPGFTLASPAKKRPAPPQDKSEDLPQPSPAKKRALEVSPIIPLSQSQALNRQLPDVATPTPLSDAPATASVVFQSNTRTSIGMRRPSGYFAQRRSLVPGAINPSDISSTDVADRYEASSGGADTPGTSSDKPHMRRASIATTVSRSRIQNENQSPVSSSPHIEPVSHSKPGLPLSESAPISIPEVVITSEENPEDSASELATMNTGNQEQTKQWMANVQPQAPSPEVEYGFDDDLPSISIGEFLMMTGVKFMDELTIPRRSTIHPSQLQGGRRDSTALPSMAEFVTAMTVHIPQLQLYSWVAKDLQTWIDNSKNIYREAEDEVAKVTPSLFREFSQANEDGRAELLHQLKLIKANKHSAAKGKWYEWKYQWVENLYENANKGFAELERDSAVLSDIMNQAKDLLPALRQQHAQILLELEKERREIEEVEQSDPDYLEELKVTIDEQNELLEVYRADVAEGHAKLERLNEKLAELEAQKQESVQAIENAERKITLNKNSTSAEVFRLKDELESLQVLHSWRIAKVVPQNLELVFDEQFLVTAPCVKYRPISAEIVISRIDTDEELGGTKNRPDSLPLFSDLIVRQAQLFIRKASMNSAKRIVEALSDFWTSCAQIRTQLRFLAIKFPLSIEPLPNQQDGECTGFKAAVSILLHKHKAKAIVKFPFDEELLAHWPFAIQKLQCEVKIAYGKVDSEEVHGAVMERLSEASVEDNHACLLDACVEAASRYE